MFVLEVKNLSKYYLKNIRDNSKRGLWETMWALVGRRASENASKYGESFYALKDISFSIKKGESVALMGRNGAGKSTLLKHIAGLTLPDSGTVSVTKSIEAMIELGAGLHPLYSGRENAAYKCALRGFSRFQTEKMVDEIIDFADLKEFADMPVKNYSSGMKARLGFAASVAMEPDLLLIDEVLSVGDFAFSQKCHARLNQLKNKSAIVFVSHSNDAMKMFCDRGLVLNKGQLLFDGGIDESLSIYNKTLLGEDSTASGKQKRFYDPSLFGDVYRDTLSVSDVKMYIDDHDLSDSPHIRHDKEIRLTIVFTPQKDLSNIHLGIPIWSSNAELLMAVNSNRHSVQYSLKSGVEVKIEVKLKMELVGPNLVFGLAIHQGAGYLFRDLMGEVLVTDILPRTLGVVAANDKWSLEG